MDNKDDALWMNYPGAVTKKAEQPLYDGNGEPWNEAAEKAEQARYQASQSQAAQPTIKTWVQRLPAASLDIMRDVSDAKDAEIAELRAHIAGTSQATKAQADDELAAKFNAAVDAEYPLPDTQHTSVKMQWVDNRAAMWRGINVARKILAPVAKEAHPDDIAVDRFTAAMKAKLAVKREQGRGGWETPECADEYLAELLMGHAHKGDPVDVANFAMMLHQRNVGHMDIAAGVLRVAALDFAKRTASMFIPSADEARVEPVASVAKEAQPHYRKATDELGLPELAEQFAAVAKLGGDYTLSAKVCGKLHAAMTTPLVAKEATRDQDEQQTNVLPPFAAPAGQQDARDPNWLLSTMDGKDWADEFCRLNNAADHSMMLAWFCNAIMTGYDTGRRHEADEQSNTAGSAKGGITNTESGSDIATTTSTVSAPIPAVVREAVEAAFEDRAGWRTKIAAAVRALDCSTEGAQKAPEEVRNQALTEAEEAVDKVMSEADDSSESAEAVGAYRCLKAIQALRAANGGKHD